MSIRDFEVLGKIGEGAYSIVYRVRRKSDNEIYALKKVVMRKLKTKEKNNALNEIRILASITHPNVISYKQSFFDEESQTLCIVMEYANGGDLYQRIIDYKKKGLQMSESFLWHLLIKLCKALKSLHDLNIMHRDIKSANVFLSKEGKVKLGDMNVSKVAKEGMNHTQTGTPYYASPEVWKDAPYDIKSDIWSLGCVIYEAAALRPPFQAEDMKGLYKKVVRGSYANLPGYSEDFNFVISLLLTLDPKKRPSALEILKNPIVQKRFAVKEESDILSSSLLNTIRLSSNILNLKEQFPESKYVETVKPEPEIQLPKIVNLQRGATYKHIEEIKRSQNTPAYSRHLSEKPRYESKINVNNFLRENYGALKMPRAKYPRNQIYGKDPSVIEIRNRDEIKISIIPQRVKGYRLAHY